jgi:hypothetical protein
LWWLFARVSGLWRGLGPLVVFAVPKNAVRFFFVEMIRNQLRYDMLKLLTTTPVFSSAMSRAMLYSFRSSSRVAIIAGSNVCGQQKR